jgi:hypothetical protein
MFEWIQRELIERGNNPVTFWIAKKTGARFGPPMRSRKTKTASVLSRGGQVGAPHELFARPPLSPLFHLCTLAPLYLRPESGCSRERPLLDFSRT